MKNAEIYILCITAEFFFYFFITIEYKLIDSLSFGKECTSLF